jgi:ribose transport system permease protein
MSTAQVHRPAQSDLPLRGAINWRDWLKLLRPLIGLIFVFTVFSVRAPDTFFTANNMRIMMVQTTIVGIAALGMTMIIITGGIDLSTGSTVAFCTVCTALLLNRHFSPVVAATGGIIAGLLVGVLIGTLITSIGLSPFIVTLSLMAAMRGTAIGASGGGGVVHLRDDYQETWIDSMLSLNGSQWWDRIPPGPWILLILSVLIAAVLRYTKFGRHVFAIGSNEQAARLCGVNIWRTKLLVYTISGALVGTAALMQFSKMSQGDATGAVGMELDVIAAVVIGGTSLAGGEGTILGSIAGAFMMTAVANGCNKLGFANWVQMIVTGGIILVAASLDRLRNRRST